MFAVKEATGGAHGAKRSEGRREERVPAEARTERRTQGNSAAAGGKIAAAGGKEKR